MTIGRSPDGLTVKRPARRAALIAAEAMPW
jgi:hypothetical protein